MFYHPVRKHYDLESMWRDAPRAGPRAARRGHGHRTLEGLTLPADMPPFRGGSFGAFPGELENEEELADAPGELPEGEDESEDLDEGEEGDVAEYDEPDDFADDEEGDYAHGDEDGEDDEDLAAEDGAGEAAPALAEAPPPSRRK